MAWILDVAFFLILLGGLALGVSRGFISGICKLAGTLFALAFAFFFCVSFEGFLENLFGMTSAISDGFVSLFSKNAAFAADLSGTELAPALENAGVPSFIASIIVNAFEGASVPEGTTAAMLISPVIAKWIAIAISFVLLVILLKLATFLADKLFSGVVDSVTPLRIINRTLGGILGLLKGAITVFLLLAICSWLPIDSLHDFIGESGIVGQIFYSDWFRSATSYVVSFQWFEDYLIKYLG